MSWALTEERKTSRKWPKLALYIRIKNGEVFKIAKGDPLGFLKLQLLQNKGKNERVPFGDFNKIRKKKSKTEIFQQCHSAEKFRT